MEIQRLKSYLSKKVVNIVLWGFGILVFVLVILHPTLHYRLGNVFFGEVPSLYNVSFAQFFFERATKPLVGKMPPYAYHQLSRTYFIQGDLNTALSLAYKETEVYPEHVHTYYIIGLTFGYMNREVEAIDAFTKFIEYMPESWAARNDKAWLQFRIGDIDGALATIEPVSLYINNPWVQNTYGTLLMNKGRYEEAEFALRNAKLIADQMSEEMWGRAYPGNDPRIYGTGLRATRNSIDKNLDLVEKLM